MNKTVAIFFTIACIIGYTASMSFAGDYNPGNSYPPGPWVILEDGTRSLVYTSDGLKTNGTISDVSSVTEIANITSVDKVDYVSAVTEIKIITPPTEIQALGKISVTTDVQELVFPNPTRTVIIQAVSGNTDALYWGYSGISNTGTNVMPPVLYPGGYVVIDYDDSVNSLYIVSGTSTNHYAIVGAISQ